MYYKPKYFEPEEIFSKLVVENHTVRNKSGERSYIDNSIWRLMDERILKTLDLLRMDYGPVIVNDYKWGGQNQYRGYRPAIELIAHSESMIDGKFIPKFSSFTSQHCHGRAIDCKFKYHEAEYIRYQIKNDQSFITFSHITAVEKDVSWLHFDVRPWNKTNLGILFF